jgi:hypothetical protein
MKLNDQLYMLIISASNDLVFLKGLYMFLWQQLLIEAGRHCSLLGYAFTSPNRTKIFSVIFNVGAITASHGSDVSKSDKDSRKGNFSCGTIGCRQIR